MSLAARRISPILAHVHRREQSAGIVRMLWHFHRQGSHGRAESAAGAFSLLAMDEQRALLAGVSGEGAQSGPWAYLQRRSRRPDKQSANGRFHANELKTDKMRVSSAWATRFSRQKHRAMVQPSFYGSHTHGRSASEKRQGPLDSSLVGE
jgi:hypothetical protein